jgi:hypothetical protein
VLHAWTQTVVHHSHVHCLVPGGGLSHDGQRWIGSRQRFLLPVKVLLRPFRGKFLALLQEAAGRGELRFAGTTADLGDPAARAAFLRAMHRKEWVVYAKPPFGSPELVLKYLARYTHRVAISNSRIVSVAGDDVTFHYRDRKHGNIRRTMTLPGVEFLRRFLLDDRRTRCSTTIGTSRSSRASGMGRCPRGVRPAMLGKEGREVVSWGAG